MAREFWINEHKHWMGMFICGAWPSSDNGGTHVIEYSAYEKLLEQNKLMREALIKISGTEVNSSLAAHIIAYEALDKCKENE